MSDEKKNNLNGLFKITRDQMPFALKLLTVAFVGILILNFANIFQKTEPGTIADFTAAQSEESTADNELVTNDVLLEERLEKILGEISGTGTVSVSVVFAEGPTREYAVNVSTTEKAIEEKDQAGGLRTTTEKMENGEVVMLDGKEQPVLVKESMPKIQGVLVVADGATQPAVKERLFYSVQALLQVPAHRITVCTRNGR